MAKSLIKSKTTWSGIASIIAGIGGYATGSLDPAAAIQLILAGFAIIFLRDAINTTSK